MHDRALYGDMDVDGNLVEDYGWDEMCPRCFHRLSWVTSSWYCPACQFKEGCCG